MEIYYLIVGIALCGILVSIWNNRQKNKQMQENVDESHPSASASLSDHDESSNQARTRDLFLETLIKLGCQYELADGDNERIDFFYQGECFSAYASNYKLYVSLWDTYWKQVELQDIDEVCCLRKAINTSNINARVTTIYTIDEANSKMIVHSKSTIPFLSSMPVIENYLRTELNVFFRAHHIIEMEMLRQRENMTGN